LNDMTLFNLEALHETAAYLRDLVPPTPQYNWPLLAKRTGCEVWVKHENHTPTGAFKARSVFGYLQSLLATGTEISGTISATRGNHGQSVALASKRAGLPSTIVVPIGNSTEKNAAMEAFGGELIVAGADFDEARGHAARIAEERSLHFIPSYHSDIVRSVATYALEFFTAIPDFDTVYVPIGLGSGICGLITTRDLLGLKTEVVGVVAENAPAMALSFEAGRPVPSDSACTFADGLACRDPIPEAFELIHKGAARIVRVSDSEIAQAICAYYTDTHNLAEGAGAAPLAALLKEREAMAGRRIGLILTGSNIDMSVFAKVIAGETPEA
jgi:threonine dehydratase